jgi:hypothetical protein
MPWGFIVGAVIVYGFTSGVFTRALGFFGWFVLFSIPCMILGYIVKFIGESLYGPGGERIVYDSLTAPVGVLIITLFLITICNGWEPIGKWFARRKKYREGVAWLAGRDHPDDLDASIEAIIFRCFAVNLMQTCRIEPERLARDVTRFRQKIV